MENRLNSSATKVEIPIETRRLSSIVGDSSYRSDYRRSLTIDQDGQQKRKDNFKLGGPFIGDTTYKSAFPISGYSPHQEEKIINPEQINTIPVKMNGQSSYKQTFNSVSSEVAKERLQPIKRKGQLKINGSFFGESVYKGEYRDEHTKMFKNESCKPKPEYSPTHGLKMSCKSFDNLASYKDQFQSYPG